MATTQPHGQYRHVDALVENIHRAHGFHPGFRAMHALGRIYRGTFTASGDGAALTRAAHFQPGATVPVTARFSSGGADPEAPFSTAAAMATKFYLDDGTVTDLVAINLPLFPIATVDDGLALLGTDDPAVKKAFLATRPKLAADLKTLATVQPAKSLAATAYNALNAFWFENEAGQRCGVRYHWVPEAGELFQTMEEMQAQPQDTLFTELEARLAQEPVRFALEVSLAEAEDDLTDPSTPWPAERKRVLLGQLAVQRRTSEEELGNLIMLHDPTKLTDGIDVSDDPILNARRGAYEASAVHRGANWKVQQAVAARDSR